jgi:hypothetical protein
MALNPVGSNSSGETLHHPRGEICPTPGTAEPFNNGPLYKTLSLHDAFWTAQKSAMVTLLQSTNKSNRNYFRTVFVVYD